MKEKHNEKKNAATIIILDIRHAEEIVLEILEKGIDIWTKNILRENNWSKYKHLFASYFSNDDFSSFNRFFNACNEIEDSRRRIQEIFQASLNEKAAIMQREILNISDPNSEEGKKSRQEKIKEINDERYVFDPGEPKDKMMMNLQIMGKLSNTLAFEKLRRLTKMS